REPEDRPSTDPIGDAQAILRDHLGAYGLVFAEDLAVPALPVPTLTGQGRQDRQRTVDHGRVPGVFGIRGGLDLGPQNVDPLGDDGVGAVRSTRTFGGVRTG